ncbi:MAG: class I tRNA ligase family protein, partial [Candidatus Saccharibacteria bacterium]
MATTPKNKFYVTTSIAYANAKPHVGYAMELLQADTLARYYRQAGQDTYFVTGTDEHGQKLKEAA